MTETMTVKQVAAACNISIATLRSWNKQHKIPFFHPTGTKKILYRKKDVEFFLFGAKEPSYISPMGKADCAEFRRLVKKVLK